MLFEKIVKKIGLHHKGDRKAYVIDIEGTDRSGKETQSKLLAEKMQKLGLKVKLFSFPNYESKSSEFVKEYLCGGYGDVNEVNEYQASLCYAVDRLHMYFTEIKDAMDSYDVIIFDRYVGSNLIHQTCKITGEDANEESQKMLEFINFWLDFEFNKLGFPKPDITILLDMPINAGKKIAKNRNNKITKKDTQDIHESNDEYMIKTYAMAKAVGDYLGWCRISCVKTGVFGEKIRSIKSISNDIYRLCTMLYMDSNGIEFTNIEKDFLLFPVTI